MTDYGYQHDCHVIDWWLHRTLQTIAIDRQSYAMLRHWPFYDLDPEDWTRYDGELL